jgi:hypothetical protein
MKHLINATNNKYVIITAVNDVIIVFINGVHYVVIGNIAIITKEVSDIGAASATIAQIKLQHIADNKASTKTRCTYHHLCIYIYINTINCSIIVIIRMSLPPFNYLSPNHVHIITRVTIHFIVHCIIIVMFCHALCSCFIRLLSLPISNRLCVHSFHSLAT